MNFRLFGCGKFRWIAIEKFDRELTPREDGFYRKHREVCFACMRYDQQSSNAMNLLNAAAIEPDISEDFDEKVLRQLRLPRRRVALTYWSPILAGAAVAGLAVLATLQLLTGTKPQFIPGRNNGAMNFTAPSSDPSTVPNLVFPPNWSTNR